MNKFKLLKNAVLINDKTVSRIWKSDNGWFWFATERVQDQISIINGKEYPDTIWYGLVQGFEDEWGDFSEAELKLLYPKVQVNTSGIIFSVKQQVD